MFKRLLKSRHDKQQPKDDWADQSSKKAPRYSAGAEPSPSPAGSLQPVEYDQDSPHYRPQSYDSINPVEYTQSPLSPASFDDPSSVTPVEYSHSPLGPERLAVKDYHSSSLKPTQRRVVQQNESLAVQRPVAQSSPPTRYTYTVDRPPTPSAVKARRFMYNELDSQPELAELPASAVPRRYELPIASTPRLAPVPPYSPTQMTQHSPHSSFGSPTGSSTSTLVPSPRSELPSPQFGRPKSNPLASPTTDENSGIKKFVVDVYCPLKRDAHGNRREQIPQDVREFRLAKVALIPIVAGKRTFVSLDLVFGEVDRPYADIVEKHFSCFHQTRLTEVEPGTVYGGQVYTIGPLNIAYRDGESAVVYVKFPTLEDKKNFQAAFWDMWQYVEQPRD